MFLKSDRYITRQVSVTAFYAVLILSVVLVLGNIFKEINELLVDRRAPISFLGIFILKLLPVSLVFTIPWGFLAAVLLVFGRLSSDQEINSLRTAGMGLYRIASPILFMGLLLSLLCLWLNATVSPRSKGELKVMLYETFKEDPLRLLDPGVVQSRMKGQRIYIESRNPDDSFQGFHAYELGADETSEWPVGYLYARDVASITPDKEVEKLELRLSGVWLEKYDEDQAIQQGSAGEIEPWILPLAAGKTRRVKANRLDNEQIRELLANPPANLTDEKLDEFDAERVRRISFSFAPLALAFVGIPLGLSARRKETSSGSGMSLGVAVAYFIFFIIADETQGSNLMLTKVLMWIPNLACLTLGTFLFRRATKRA
ncbi:LptF/LptG family permease [Akkermansiaceae bacterium]|jgi:lipopolysaccharide export LptBFGC system permease protein LptF|nr:LptF/LptG family permease [Akkermansiaceae bacterium]